MAESIISAEQYSGLTEAQRIQYYTDLRSAQLAALAVYEKLLGLPCTTKDKLDWIRLHRISDDTILTQLAQHKDCR